MRVLICGGRDLNQVEAINWLRINAHHEIAHATGVYAFKICFVIDGGARGGDAAARAWCLEIGAKGITEPAQWKRYGAMAGPTRNQAMIDKHRPDVAIALPGGRGTADMTRRLEAAGIPVIKVESLL